MHRHAVSSILGVCLAFTLAIAAGQAWAIGTSCASDGKGKLCCATTDVEGDKEVECTEGGNTCNTVQAPKHCDFEQGSDDYCFCKTLQTCAEACAVVDETDTYQMGAAAKDLYDHCGHMIRHYAGNDAMDQLKICRQTDPASFDVIQDNCGKFVKHYCDKMGS